MESPKNLKWSVPSITTLCNWINSGLKYKHVKILVTGGSGFLGTYLVEELLKKKFEVTILCRNKPIKWHLASVKFIFGSIEDKNIVEKAVINMDWVFHVASKAGVWGDYQTYYSINVLGTKNIIETCKKFKISK